MTSPTPKQPRPQSTEPEKVYILSMERYGDREGHHYNCGIFTCLADACVEGLEHENFRAGKYEMRIEFCPVDDNLTPIKEIPRDVAVSYAIMKYPEKFDDKRRLKMDGEL